MGDEPDAVVYVVLWAGHGVRHLLKDLPTLLLAEIFGKFSPDTPV